MGSGVNDSPIAFFLFVFFLFGFLVGFLFHLHLEEAGTCELDATDQAVYYLLLRNASDQGFLCLSQVGAVDEVVKDISGCFAFLQTSRN